MVSSVEPVEPVELNVPTIDLAATISDDDVVEIVSNACAEYGFFQIINHGISSDLIDCYLDECRRYFALPLDVRNSFDSIRFDWSVFSFAFAFHSCFPLLCCGKIFSQSS